MAEFEVKFEGQQYDVATFLKNHPGGVNYVKGFKEKDIKDKMEATMHSKSAFYLMREYRVGGRDEDTHEEHEDLEKLVDWNRGLLWQVPKLGDDYIKWVVAPVDRQLRLFDNDILENLTLTPWYVIPIIWLPVTIYYIFWGCKTYMEYHNLNSMPIIPVVFYFCSGLVIWSIMEYSLHRWVFHMDPGGSKALIFIHFIMHGNHHKVPFDSRRLVFPPLPAFILLYVFYNIFKLVLPETGVDIITAGTLLGYVIYDLTHYYLHYGSPSEGTYFYRLKRYHNHHHFSHHDSGFGVSNTSWDSVFGTLIKLRKLAMGIKWS